MKIDIEKALAKGRMKSILREAFIAGGRYYLKNFGRGDIPKKDIGEVEDFDTWYNKQYLKK